MRHGSWSRLALLFLLLLLASIGWPGGFAERPAPLTPRVGTSVSPAPPPDEPAAKLAPELGRIETAAPELTVLLRDPTTKQQLASWIEAKGGKVLRGAEGEGSALVVILPQQEIPELAARPEVQWVEPTYQRRFLGDRAAEVIASAPLKAPGWVLPQGLTGQGELVGIADNGLNTGDLNRLPPPLQGKVRLLRSWGAGGLADPTGHGTQLAGIVAGGGERFPGIAPGASIYFQAIAGPDGKTPDPPADLEELFSPAYAAGVRVELCGWGGGRDRYGAAAFQIDRFCYQHPDFLPIFAAGNGGPAPGTVTAEACAKNALAVGATENPRPLFGTFNPTRVADISSRGPTADGRIKPDLVAPGMGIIGPCSQLVSSNLPGNPLYLRADGTSQAAAVAAGGALLLRQYLEEQSSSSPPAALLKALLINGARLLGDKPNNATGYGLIDVGGTVLALKTGSFRWATPEHSLSPGERATFWYPVADPTRPLKVTLCWTDPPASPGAPEILVNHLLLTVYGPDGERYSAPLASASNVQQVVLSHPRVGTYRIEVTATQGVGPQSFALVYGQPLSHGVLEAAQGDRLTLTGGRELVASRVQEVENGRLVAPDLRPGTDIYYLPGGPVFAVVETRTLAPARFLPVSSGMAVTCETPALQDGGYLLAQDKVEAEGRSLSPQEVPPGARVSLVVNPRTQEAWGVKASWQEVQGFLWSLDSNEVKLIDKGSFPFSPGMVVTQQAQEEALDPMDRLFGVPPTAEFLPGLKVTLFLDPRTREVLHLKVQQRLISGYLETISQGEVVLSDGRRWQMCPGVTLPSHWQAGERVMGVLAPDKPELLRLWAEPALYGRIILVEGSRIYFQDQRGEVRFWTMAPCAGFYRDGIQVGAVGVWPGAFARLLLDEKGKVSRVDLLRQEPHSFTGKLEAVRGQNLVVDGRDFRTGVGTMFWLEDQPVTLQDLRPGQEVRITAVASGGQEWALMVSALASAPPPRLWVKSTGQDSWEGFTTARRLYLLSNGGRQVLTPEASGCFSFRARPTDRLVAVGEGVKGGRLEELAGYLPFRDLAGHWSRPDVVALWGAGIVSGYDDGTFRPDRPITKVEMAALMARCFSLPPGTPLPPGVPSWAREAVQAVIAAGYMSPTAGGGWDAEALVTRAQAAIWLAHGVKGPKTQAPPTPAFKDWDRVPEEARLPVAYLASIGVYRGRGGDLFAPDAYLTRAEAAVLLYRLRFLD
ncbi:S8 family serine peptidase [Desulfothermobacter acidiphilus]|uniref:S8 family serine peptidase n=1 Tax=Desulfothermobacter acidiphilus TaxID=1938353 RepID=UPI003F8B9870